MSLDTIVQRRAALEAQACATGADLDLRNLDQEALAGTPVTWAEYEAQGQYLADLLEAYPVPQALRETLGRLIRAGRTIAQNDVRAAA